MKENTLDVLFYLFDNYPDMGDNLPEDRASMHGYLQDAGFLNSEITRAFDWLESLGDDAERVEVTYRSSTTRIFSPQERYWLDGECQGYLMFLEHAGVISAEAREQILDRVLELQDEDFNLDRLKWVVLMVLLNRPEEGNSFFWAEGLSVSGEAPVFIEESFTPLNACGMIAPLCEQPTGAAMTTQPNWFTELSDSGTIFGLELTDAGKIHEEQTPFQKLAIYDTKTFGKLMTLDGCTMVTTRDNFVYHEMMAHPVLFSHPAPKRVCIIGGGDCGTLREVLRHPEVEAAIQIDIDERVTRVSEMFFPELCESNNDPRATLAFEDGIAWINNAEPGSLDVLIVDSTDPVGPGAVLYSEEFFRGCWRALGENGLLVQQSESPLVHAEKIIKPMHDTMRKAGFSDTKLHQFQLVSYPTGWWSCTIAAKAGKVEFARQAAAEALAFPTCYYNAGVHQGSAALPQFMKELLG